MNWSLWYVEEGGAASLKDKTNNARLSIAKDLFNQTCEVDISKINYVGWKKDKAGNIDYTRGTNVILDYFFYTIFGQYQEEE